ncbi:uncharacterized protein LOC126837485 [Adelges cooleyi]|uniref:uncharacterized protein LOC126837485 n=1 Tax=Adelges cooleyi TaxID=133065 RepID=UPI0021800DD6|nr:uncharacterized protein LOC126837485 [Adelges cooleyi]
MPVATTSSNDDNEDLDKEIYKTSDEIEKLTELGNARRELTGKAIINVLTQKLAENLPVNGICVFIALWLSLITSSMMEYTIEYTTGDEEICVVKDENYNLVQYRAFGRVYYQVYVNNINSKIQELKVQLRDSSIIPRFVER